MFDGLLLDGGTLGEDLAIPPGRKCWEALSRFLDAGVAEIDNNIAERAMRSVAVGRKNWLFAGSKAGGERAAAIYSVIETCKLNSIEPQAYIADVIEKIAADGPLHAGMSSCPGIGPPRRAKPASRLHSFIIASLWKSHQIEA